MYIDTYIIENLLINYIIISATSILIKNPNKLFRKIIGAVIGTLYSVLYLFPNLYLLFELPSKIIFLMFIGLISFSFNSKKEFFNIMTIFLIVNIFICGSTYFIIYFTGMDDLTVSFIILCAYISCQIIKKIYSDIRLIKHMSEYTREVTISLLGEKLICKALLDSGNLLKDPISKNDVVMVKFNLLEKYLPKGYNYENINVSAAEELINDLDGDVSSRIRLIPYNHAASSNTSMILGIKADYLQVDNKKIGNIILGISSLKNDEYDVILNPSVIS